MCSKAYIVGVNASQHQPIINLAAKQTRLYTYTAPVRTPVFPIQPRCAARHSGVRATRNLTFLYVAD